MKTVLASVFALSLMSGAMLAAPAQAAHVGVHVGPLGVGMHVGGHHHHRHCIRWSHHGHGCRAWGW